LLDHVDEALRGAIALRDSRLSRTKDVYAGAAALTLFDLERVRGGKSRDDGKHYGELHIG
jgi:hypothetical protein